MISAHTFAYISLDAMIPQEADQTHIEYGFPVLHHDPVAAAEKQTILANVTRTWVFKQLFLLRKDSKPGWAETF